MKKIAINTLLVAALSSTAPAYAVCDGCVVGAVEKAGALITMTITTVATGLTALIQNGFGGLASSIGATTDATAKLQIIANEQLMSAQKDVTLKTTKTVDAARVAGEHKIAGPGGLADPCVTFGAGEAARSAQAAYEGMASAKAAAIQQNLMATRNRDALVFSAYSRYQKYFSGNTMRDADVLADSLLSGATRMGREKLNTFTPNDVAAAEAFLFNATDSAPPEEIPEYLAATAEGQKYRMMLRAERARQSISIKSYADALASRIAVPGLKDKVGQIWNAMSRVISPGVKAPTGDLSYREFMTTEIERRYSNPTWYVQIAAATPANVLREIAFMLALDMHQRQQAEDRQEKIELLLAQINQNGVVSSGYRQQIAQQRARVR